MDHDQIAQQFSNLNQGQKDRVATFCDRLANVIEQAPAGPHAVQGGAGNFVQVIAQFVQTYGPLAEQAIQLLMQLAHGRPITPNQPNTPGA